MKIAKFILVITGGIFCIILAFFIYQFVSAGFRYANAAGAEYPTFDVIQDVVVFVEDNSGSWPTTWEDLGLTDEMNEHVCIRFDVTSEQIIADPGLIHEVIQPVTGPWRVHPHGEPALKHLRERITEVVQQSAEE